MTLLHETSRRRDRQAAPAQLLDASVADPPLNEAGFLRVEVESQLGAVQECPWVGPPGTPTTGDAAAVVESDAGNYWAVWWPQGGPLDAPGALGPAGGDLGGEFPDPAVKAITGVAGMAGGKAARVNNQHAIYARTDLRLDLRSNYNPETDRLVNTAQPSWMLTLQDSATDRWRVSRAAATAGAPSYVVLGSISNAGAADFIGTLTQNGTAVVLTNDTRLTADQPAGVASVRTLGAGALQAAAGNHLHAGVYQPNDATLATLAALATAADRLPYFTGTDTAALATLTAFARTLLDDADSAAARATLGLVLGTNVQAQADELQAIADLTLAADRLVYFTGPAAAAATTLSAFIRTLLDDADAATARGTLGAQAQTAATSALADISPIADTMAYFISPTAAARTPLTAFMRTLLDDADAATARSTLGAAAAGAAPAAHATTHQPGGSDAMAVDAVASTASLRTLGTGSQQAAAGNDTRLSDTRTPSNDSVRWDRTGVDLQGLARGAFEAYLAADIGPVAANTQTTLAGLTEEYDPGGDFTPATGVYVAPFTGVYEFHCTLLWKAVAAGMRAFADLCLSADNSALRRFDYRRQSANPDDLYLVGTARARLVAGTGVIVRTEHGDATARNLSGGAGGAGVCRIMGKLIGRTT